MTVGEAIARIDSLKPNAYTRSDKIRWLNEVDTVVQNQIIDTREKKIETGFTGYNDDTANDQKLILETPHDRVYLYYMESQIDYYNHEMIAYSNSSAMYNYAYAQMQNDFNRKYRAKRMNFSYFSSKGDGTDDSSVTEQYQPLS